MKHCDITRWVDFARGLGSATERTLMEGHLEGCDACRLAFNLFLRTEETAARSRGFQVPQALVDSAMLIFPASPIKPRQRLADLFSLPSLTPHLRYNSMTEPLALGVRSAEAVPQQVMYESGNYVIDLQVHARRESTLVSLAGQIVNQKFPDAPLSGLPVYVVSSGKVVAETVSNQVGEFCMEYSPKRNLRLRVPLPEAGAQINVSLNVLGTHHA